MAFAQKSFIIEGVDRLGKSTLIENIQQKLGFYNVIHYQKPKQLAFFSEEHKAQNKLMCLENYQYASFKSMFKLIASEEPFIMDRGHLGEVVYSERYRGYSGDYVMELEKKALWLWNYNTAIKDPYPAKLILLTTSDFSFIKDDGNSFDFSAKANEQDSFIRAFNNSVMPKILIDVSNRNGSFKDPQDILAEALA